jgi:hypothetical protein
MDSFPVLYSAVGLLYRLRTLTEFTLDVGEGFELHGTRSDGPQDLTRLSLMVSDRVHVRVPMTTPQTVFFLSRLISDLARSISAVGIDPYAAFEKFPPPSR